MNNKVTLPRLVTRIASSSGRSKKQVEDFLKTLFSVIGDSLAIGESVKVKGLGTFKVLNVEPRKSVNVSTGEDHQIPAHKKIVFTPDKELAAKVNAPFEMFDTVEISDDIHEEDFETVDKETEIFLEGSDKAVNLVVSDDSDQLDGSDVSVESAPAEDLETEEESDPVLEKDALISDVVVPTEGEDNTVRDTTLEKKHDNIECYAINHQSSQRKRRSRHHKDHRSSGSNSYNEGSCEDSHSSVHSRSRLGRGFVLGFCSALLLMLVGFGITWFVMNKRIDQFLATYRGSVSAETEVIETSGSGDTDVDNENQIDANVEAERIDATTTAKEENAVMPETKASDVVIDTISLSRYLTTMARDHYGNYHLWAYIYKENEGKLGDPDRIRPGTTVVIPDLKKYGVDPKNKEDIRKAKTMGQQIYKRYNK